MGYTAERYMYPPVCEWLEGYLKTRHQRAQIKVYDSSRTPLARLIQDRNLGGGLPGEWPSWDIRVDVVGFILTPERTELAFVECKNRALNLRDLSQLLGYSRVARPAYSFLLAPQGASASLVSLLVTHRRIDVLEYTHNPGTTSRYIVVAPWSVSAQTIEVGDMITGDYGRRGRL